MTRSARGAPPSSSVRAQVSALVDDPTVKGQDLSPIDPEFALFMDEMIMFRGLLAGGSEVLLRIGARLASFGEDAQGELHVVDLNGTVYRIVPAL